MKKELKCIMLVDDNIDDNFFHEWEIKRGYPEIVVVVKQTGLEALEYLKLQKDKTGLHPNLILLDINMPGMNGWEFLSEYNKLDEKLQSEVLVVMLTNSENPDDIEKAKSLKMTSGFKTKPLTQEMLKEIKNMYFKD